MKRHIFLLLIFFAITIPSFLSAESRSVFINEIAWMGTPVTGVEEKQWWRHEWLELFNVTDQPVALDGWTVELSREKLDFTVSLKGTIVPNGYYVVGASEKILNLDLNYKNLGGKFFNGGQRVVLKSGSGEIIDELDARSGWQAGDNKSKQTMERLQGSDPCIQGSEPCMEWQTSKESGGTPKAQNSEGVRLSLAKNEVKLSSAKDATEKDLPAQAGLSGHSTLRDEPSGSDSKRSFQSRVHIVNPITLLAGLLALGSSGALLLAKRYLASRLRSGQALRQKNRRTST